MRYLNSQLKKHVEDLNIYAPPGLAYDVANQQSQLGGNLDFEKIQEAKLEDRARFQSARRLMIANGKVLSRELQECTAKGQVVKTCASFRYWRQVRRKWNGQFLELLNEHFDLRQAVCVTIVPPEWLVKRLKLKLVTAKDLKFLLRELLRSAGLLVPHGAIYLALHASHSGDDIQFHVHGIIVGEKVKALENLRTLPSLQATKRVRIPLKVQKLQGPDYIPNAAKFLGYSTRLYWTYEPFIIDENRLKKQIKTRQRIPEPMHAEMLHWFAKARPSDFFFMSGINFKKSGTKLKLQPSQVLPQE
jgi:hypothetical protein